MSIIIPDIDHLIINLLDIPELLVMVSTNKYFHEAITKIPLYIQWHDIYINNRCYILASTFFCTCKKGYLEYAKSLIQRYRQIDIHHCNEHPFQCCCVSGNLDLCKWFIKLAEQRNNKINIHADHDLAFIWSCGFGKLNIAKWLIGLGEESYGRINIHNSHDKYTPFELACTKNYLEIAQYLIHLGENCGYDKINVHRTNIFNKCHPRITEWLLTLEPTYGVFQKD